MQASYFTDLRSIRFSIAATVLALAAIIAAVASTNAGSPVVPDGGIGS